MAEQSIVEAPAIVSADEWELLSSKAKRGRPATVISILRKNGNQPVHFAVTVKGAEPRRRRLMVKSIDAFLKRVGIEDLRLGQKIGRDDEPIQFALVRMGQEERIPVSVDVDPA